MGRSKRAVFATVEETSTPPTILSDGEVIARIAKANGSNLWYVDVPGSVSNSSMATLLVELPARFRQTIWLKKGGYVVVNRNVFHGRDNKLGGEIVNIVREEKQWRKQSYW